ncbi:bifunctional DNA-formamidopyrimidine glycosylase/DNA-(apurinic or apyrimidinic site) lyase [Vibrio aestuarianus]|uniref:Formamidopyrimidine-DNA glycosylase n=1 Tax=Vibrio aestuarianus TaxID=28171 RepID=A0ABD7YKY6_9VIBR|nr:bifunctional DNA-formamidopyrimidine glycosylase/DNA-(apurinic or apyrimidinic site) lyase [Vibrio aestuarianus]KOE84908.1 formamidopyrimidine-DNA glycosylase [Vibrio alginolyticus]MDE1230878.1 bifunctional DNA-formamidopyrimidine glycosylase/DNA-(apurinic or apyrimidinic site) lyase [Vibrio aestuarianus]MDE1234323.1 bifunctional DNA-formamidopyrimidine glycosylase/DNA-(apurinic or apyrimidinic site) lyase [Vibrio aestuarianus]MDE1245231.1 bifunctional DNA-formamidopyrimidine glycosylase/DNA
MPELPEVEVSKMGITPHLVGQTIQLMTFRTPKLRWDIPQELKQLEGQVIRTISRRAKYLLIETDIGSAIVHLGMSGSLRVLDCDFAAGKHDHVDLKLTNGKVLRYNDPRRFGAWLWCEKGQSHSVLSNIGPEPLTEEFSADYMLHKAKSKRIAVKQFIMENKVVVGVGNIYASESLFNARIHPTRPANSISEGEWVRLVSEIKSVLASAIQQGGTTLKDFAQADGKPGYFAQELNVYGKAKQLCPVCGEAIEEQKIAQRNTFFCSSCQK